MAFDFTIKKEDTSLKSTSTKVPASADLDQYVGTYQSDLLPMDLTISQKGNQLIGQGTGQPSFPLEADGEHVFSNKEIGLKITFLPGEKKMSFNQGGAKFEMAMKD